MHRHDVALFPHRLGKLDATIAWNAFPFASGTYACGVHRAWRALQAATQLVTARPWPCPPPPHLAQGLFHPARKVRETYWRLYNNTYIGAQDALVALYPRLEDDGNNTYTRHELDLVI
jgi:hypothetical protein